MPIKHILAVLEDGFLPLEKAKTIASKFGMTLSKIEKIALENEIIPLRYRRNTTTITPKNQLKLLTSSVAIIGCGGIGGYAAEHLTRIGVGNLTLIDDDIFCEHNLNRQRFSNLKRLGTSKVTAAKEDLEAINPTVQIKAIAKKFNLNDTTSLGLDDVDVIIDALDHPVTKRELALFALSNNIPLVHGAIAGTAWQVGNADSVIKIYNANDGNGADKYVGNLTYTAALCAAIQSSEAVKILLNHQCNVDGLLIGDLLDFEVERLTL